MSPWYVARASGIIAYLLLALAAAAGLVMSTKFVEKKHIRQFTIVHEALSIASLAAVLVHVWAIVNDEFFDFSWVSALLPWGSPYEPFWTGVGVVAMYLLVLTDLSFYVRKKIGPRVWRRLHYASPLLFVTATMHGLAAGTDSQEPLAFAMYVGATVAVGGLLTIRLGTPVKEKPVRKERSPVAVKPEPNPSPPREKGLPAGAAAASD